MSGYASSMLAIISAEVPTPPMPYIATESPGLTFAVFMTAPAPVSTAHPTTDEMSLGLSSSMGMTYPPHTSASSPQVYVAPLSGSSWYVAPPASGDHLPFMGSLGTHVTIARSPSLTWVTLFPTATTLPVPSCPRRLGVGVSGLCIWCSCEWHTPLEYSLTWT